MVRKRATFILIAALAAFFVAWSGVLAEGPVWCPFRRFTGLPCGSCGLTRAATAIAQGRLSDAFHFHAASIPFAAGVLLALILVVRELLTGKPHLTPFLNRWARVLVAAAIVLILIGWALNLSRLFGTVG